MYVVKNKLGLVLYRRATCICGETTDNRTLRLVQCVYISIYVPPKGTTAGKNISCIGTFVSQVECCNRCFQHYISTIGARMHASQHIRFRLVPRRRRRHPRRRQRRRRARRQLPRPRLQRRHRPAAPQPEPGQRQRQPEPRQRQQPAEQEQRQRQPEQRQRQPEQRQWQPEQRQPEPR